MIIIAKNIVQYRNTQKTIANVLCQSLFRNMSQVNNSTQTLQDIQAVSDLMSKRELVAAYLFIGNGAKLQYKSLDEVKLKLSPILDELQAKHGASKWLAVYGGDSYVKEKPDLGAVMAFVKEKYDIPLVAVQGWPQVDDFVDYVLTYEEQRDVNGRTIYGGVVDGKLLGGTNIYLCDEFQKLLRGVINLDSKGRIGKTEVEYARKIGLNVIDVIPLTPKNY